MASDRAESAVGFRFPLRVYYEDTDAAGVVYYANYLKFIERARTEWLRAEGVELSEVERDDGIVFAVRSVTAEYLRPARLGDLLHVATRLTRLRNASIELDQVVERDGRPLVACRVLLASLDAAAFRPRPIPDYLKRKISRWNTP